MMTPNTDQQPDNDNDSDRDALVEKITEKLKNASTDDLKEIAQKLGMNDDNKSTEPTEADIPKVIKPAAPVVDTSLLTGSRANLKNFLIKKSMDNSDEV